LVNGEAAERTAATITASGGEASAILVDVTDPVAVRNMVDTCVERFGRLEYTRAPTGEESGDPFADARARARDDRGLVAELNRCHQYRPV
jgi:NAD(P)-dependent dehydrogenase (short-subunit alcohol dehydrogenase family)